MTLPRIAPMQKRYAAFWKTRLRRSFLEANAILAIEDL